MATSPQDRRDAEIRFLQAVNRTIEAADQAKRDRDFLLGLLVDEQDESAEQPEVATQ